MVYGQTVSVTISLQSFFFFYHFVSNWLSGLSLNCATVASVSPLQMEMEDVPTGMLINPRPADCGLGTAVILSFSV